jgi:hypothetical protein
MRTYLIGSWSKMWVMIGNGRSEKQEPISWLTTSSAFVFPLCPLFLALAEGIEFLFLSIATHWGTKRGKNKQNEKINKAQGESYLIESFNWFYPFLSFLLSKQNNTLHMIENWANIYLGPERVIYYQIIPTRYQTRVISNDSSYEEFINHLSLMCWLLQLEPNILVTIKLGFECIEMANTSLTYLFIWV